MARFSLLIAPAALAIASGCQSAGPPPASPAAGVDDGVAFACADGTTLLTRFDQGAVTVIIPERAQMHLPQVVSASGARYSNGNVTFWNKGSEATWIVGDRPPVTCRTTR